MNNLCLPGDGTPLNPRTETLMKKPNPQQIYQTPATDSQASVSAPVAELAILIDAIPAEYRDDVLRAALWLGTNRAFQESYMVASLRSQLCDCLLEKTGTLHDLRTLRQCNLPNLERRLNQFTEGDGIEQIAVAIERLLSHLVDVL